MKDQLWEEKWDDFSKKEIREEIEQDKQNVAEYEKILNYLTSHENEVKDVLRKSMEHRSDFFPRDDVFTFTFDQGIEGHSIYWRLETALSRDGDEETDGEFEIDDKNMLRGLNAPNVVWDIDSYLSELCYQLV